MKKEIIFVSIFYIFVTPTFSQNWTNFNQSNSGLFSNGTYGITTDIYNNIWIGLGTGSLQGNGIDKFDGVNWTHYDTLNSGLPRNPVRPIKGDAFGNIWLHYWSGSGSPLPGLTKFNGTNWIVYDTSYSTLLSNAIDIKTDKQNNLWISCLGGIVKYDGITFTNYFHIHWGFLAVQDSANIWMGGSGISHLNPITGVWTDYDTNNSNIPGLNVSGIAVDTTGLVWVSFGWSFNTGRGTTNGGIATFDGNTFTPIWPFQNVYTSGSDIIVDANNNIWEATSGEGVYKFDGITWTPMSLPTAGSYDKLLADQQNNIWVSNFYSGIWTNSQTVGIPEQVTPKIENLFPNPANNIVVLSLLNSKNVRVLNSHGETVVEKKFSSNTTGRVELDVSFLSSGIYFIQAGNEVRKFVKE